MTTGAPRSPLSRFSHPEHRRDLRNPLNFDLDTDATPDQLDTLLRLTERYCVVYQTLARPAQLSATLIVPAPR